MGKHVTRSILKINNSFVLGWDHKPQLAEIDFSLVLCFERFFRKNQWKTGPPRILLVPGKRCETRPGRAFALESFTSVVHAYRFGECTGTGEGLFQIKGLSIV